ncbi:MAG: hypothetical protein AVDCRST_MAG77-1207, partial [uncultured Chloroflexi bacterium]
IACPHHPCRAAHLECHVSGGPTQCGEACESRHIASGRGRYVRTPFSCRRGAGSNWQLGRL